MSNGMCFLNFPIPLTFNANHGITSYHTGNVNRTSGSFYFYYKPVKYDIIMAAGDRKLVNLF